MSWSNKALFDKIAFPPTKNISKNISFDFDLKIFVIKNSKASHRAFFSYARRYIFVQIFYNFFFFNFSWRTKRIILQTLPKSLLLGSVTIHKNWLWTKFLHGQYKRLGILKKIATPIISLWNKTVFKKLGFPENPTTLTLLCKVPQSTIILVKHRFFKTIIWK